MTAPLIVMGVAGSGKSSLASSLASALGWPLIEGDDFHTDASRDKMRNGIALEDADREQWLDRLAAEASRCTGGSVLACSALKRKYRDRLRAALPGARFVYLQIEPALARERVAARAAAHLFPPSLVASQFATLESPEGEPGVLTLPSDAPLEASTRCALQWARAPRQGSAQ